MRRLNITASNLGSYNSLFSLGNIRKDQREGTINFTTMQEGLEGRPRSGKMGDFASSTITDLRQLMMNGEMNNLVQNSSGAAAASLEGSRSNHGNLALPQKSKPRFNLNNTISGSRGFRMGTLSESLRRVDF